MDSAELAVDFGTSNTVAVLRRGDGPAVPLLFDASPLLASGVFAGPDGLLLTGVDAQRAAAGSPAGFEANPKRRIDDGTLWLGGQELAVGDVIALVLRRVHTEATRALGREPTRVTLTHPVTWSTTRLEVLAGAARAAGLPDVHLVAEPVAAAAYFAGVIGADVALDRHVVVYDFGAGTFDVCVLQRTADGFEVVASAGLPDAGGLDLDAAVVAHARALTGESRAAWERLDRPQTGADLRARQQLWGDARWAKEQLSRHARTDLHVPLVDTAVQLTREEFERAAGPLLERTVDLTSSTLREAGVPRQRVAGVFLVGGSSRVPLAASLLHRALGIAPTVLEQPELVVAEGALDTPAVAAPVAPRQPQRQPRPPTEPDEPVEPVEPIEQSPPHRPRERQWWLTRAGAFALVVAAVLGVTFVLNHLDTGHGSGAPVTALASGPASGSMASPSGIGRPPTGVSSAQQDAELALSRQFIPRIPPPIHDLGCTAAVVLLELGYSDVFCGHLDAENVDYHPFSSAAAMDADFNTHQSSTALTGGDCSGAPRQVVTTYARGTHHGKIRCEAGNGSPSSDYIIWTDDSLQYRGEIRSTGTVTYQREYQLWTQALEVAPA